MSFEIPLVHTDEIANPARVFRQLGAAPFTSSGILDASSLVVSASSSPNDELHVSTGQVLLRGTTSPDTQGAYSGVNTTQVDLVWDGIDGAEQHATQTRIDTIVLTLKDSEYDSGVTPGDDRIEILIHTGTPGAGAVDDATLAANYDTWLRIADITIRPATTVTGTEIRPQDITDKRTYAHPRQVVYVGGGPGPGSILLSTTETVLKRIDRLPAGTYLFSASVDIEHTPILGATPHYSARVTLNNDLGRTKAHQIYNELNIVPGFTGNQILTFSWIAAVNAGEKAELFVWSSLNGATQFVNGYASHLLAWPVTAVTTPAW